MAPELVVAGAPSKVYPGGIIVLQATDWLAAGRGTLSTEADARAINGSVVRDTQTVATSLFSDAVGSFQAADDTLEIDVSALSVLVDMTYEVWFSVLIEGDWDTTNSDTFRDADQHSFSFACALGWYGTVNSTTDADPNFLDYLPRDRPHYTINSSTTTGDLAGSETIFVRAYARSGTTCEFLIDQVFLVPWVSSGTHAGWTVDDFESVGGQANTFGSIGYDPPETGTGFVDGADGGDANGKFTWSPIPSELSLVLTADEGGGDYQKSTDNEYMVRVVPDDNRVLLNTEPSPDEEAPGWAYAVHGTNFRPAKTWVDDDFTRTVAEGTGAGRWGTGPQGFGWFTSTSSALMSVNGSQGVMTSNDFIGSSACIASLSPSAGGAQAAAQINTPNYTISGTLEIPVAPVGGASDFVFSKVGLFGRAGAYPDFELVFDHQGGDWTIESGGGNIFHGPNASPSSYMGWKMEIRRHRLRVKVWDAVGAEPGTWDYDSFPPNGPDAYPYGDDLAKSTEFVAFYPVLSLNAARQVPNFSVLWDDILIDYDPYGDPGDMTATIEHPHGTQVGTIGIPYGAWQMVYWGKRLWTEDDAFGDPYLSFSAKVWNEAGTAELQRAEALLWYFRAVRGLDIVSMNWSQALPVDITRVHG